MNTCSTAAPHSLETSGVRPLTVTVATAKKISGLGNTTIWALIKKQELETVRVGRRTLVTFCSLEALLDPDRAGRAIVSARRARDTSRQTAAPPVEPRSPGRRSRLQQP